MGTRHVAINSGSSSMKRTLWGARLIPPRLEDGEAPGATADQVGALSVTVVPAVVCGFLALVSGPFADTSRLPTPSVNAEAVAHSTPSAVPKARCCPQWCALSCYPIQALKLGGNGRAYEGQSSLTA